MEFYINNIYYANGHYGILAAANGYFGKGINQLSLSQMTFLCSIPNNPNMYDPLTSIENTIERRDRILRQMYGDGGINLIEYRSALNEQISLLSREYIKNDYVETFIFNSAIKSLMKEEGFIFRNQFVSKEEKSTYDEAYNDMYNRYQSLLYSGGYRIYTSIDIDKQERLQVSVNEVLKEFTDTSNEGIYKLQGAAVCIDNDTGRVAAIVGGRSQEHTGYTLNRGYQSYRQPGSAIKPLIEIGRASCRERV